MLVGSGIDSPGQPRTLARETAPDQGGTIHGDPLCIVYNTVFLSYTCIIHRIVRRHARRAHMSLWRGGRPRAAPSIAWQPHIVRQHLQTSAQLGGVARRVP